MPQVEKWKPEYIWGVPDLLQILQRLDAKAHRRPTHYWLSMTIHIPHQQYPLDPASDVVALDALRPRLNRMR